ncbi:MAG TPA: lamin tail domain-containing protein [bacterium]|nr:lamin tail domain-containing protein [bacterium]
MKHFLMIVAWVLLALFFVACEGNNSNNKKDDDTVTVADDNLLVDEDGITPIDEEPEGEADVDQKTDKDNVVKDDGPVVTDDGTVEPDDGTVVTDDATVEPDDTAVVTDEDAVVTDDITTDDVVTDDVVTDDIATDDVTTDDIVADGDELLNDDDIIVYVDPCLPDNPCTTLNQGVCTDANLDGVEECGCDDGYTFDGGSICINQKEVPCDTDNDNPENSSDIVDDVTVNYADGEWELPADCVWECDTDYIEDNYNACVLAAGPCADSPCTEEHKHACADDGDGNPVCSCDEHYNDDDMDGTCEPDIQTVACTNELKANSHWLPSAPYSGDGHVTQTWDGTQFAPTADFCPQGCNTDYTLEGGVCINEKQVDCAANPAKPANSHDIIEKVTIFFVGETWGAPDFCDWDCNDGYHWNEDVEECLEILTIDWCNLEAPADITLAQGADLTVYGRVRVIGVTDLSAEVDVMPQIIGQLSGNPSHGVDAATWPWDGWMDLDPNPDNESAVGIGDTDEYLLTVPMMTDPIEMDITVRFSGDSGNTWTYCNANRLPAYNGTDAENPYDPLKHGRLTVTGGYVDPCAPENPCTEENQTVCTDENLDGVEECGCDDGYHWNDDVEECLETLTIDWCNLETPTDITFYRGETVAVYGRVRVIGVTDQTADVDTMPQLLVQVGSGAAETSATGWGDQWGPMDPNPDNYLIPGIGDNDEYQYIGPVTETLGDWDMSVRVSGDSGATWTYCNANRSPEYNGTDDTEPYDYLKNGHFTVVSPCGEGFCVEPNKSVCADSDNEPFYTCSCDENYHDDGGNCTADTRTVACTSELPANAYWGTDEEHDGDGNVAQTWSGEAWLPSEDFCPIDCYGGYHKEGDSCVSNTRLENCTENKPTNSHWIPQGNYNGDGTVLQNWTLADGWQPPADECPWACDVDHHVRWDPMFGQFCDPDTQLVACTNTLPDNAVWRTEGVYGGGKLTQTWDGDSYEPATDTCPSDCDETYHYETSSEKCVSNTIGRLCTNTKPTDSLWTAEDPYDGNGNLIQTWVGPGDDDWTPATDTCKWHCPVDTHYETSSNACVTNTIGRLCTNDLPDGADWVEAGVYDGLGHLTQTWVGPGDDDWTPDTDTCPWACTDPLYHENLDLNECLLTLTIDECNLESPLTHTGLRGSGVDVYGRVLITGVTDSNAITVSLPQLLGQLGAGPRAVDPMLWGDTWMDAAPYQDVDPRDEYEAAAILDIYPGEYDYAYRFSGDSGQTWTYCTGIGALTVQCAGSDDCTDNADTPLCGPMNLCVECTQDSECGDGLICDTAATYTCVECVGDGDCTDGKVCDEPVNLCKLPGKLVINEVDYDQSGTDYAEYVEIFNSGEMSYDMTGVTIEFWNGSVNAVYATYNLASIGSLEAGGLLVVHSVGVTPASGSISLQVLPVSNAIQNGDTMPGGQPDGMKLLDDSVLVDGLHYENVMLGVGEGSAAPTDDPALGNFSLSRCPNGADTDDNGVDFILATPTPGAANSCL